MDRYTVISADCHAGADLLDYRGYLDPQYRDEFDGWAKTYVNPFGDLTEAEAERNWNSERRNADLDREGIAGEVIFPNTVPPFFPQASLAAPAAADRSGARAALGRPAGAQSLAGRLLLACRPSGAPGWARSCSETSTKPSPSWPRSPSWSCAAVCCCPGSPPAPAFPRFTPSTGSRSGRRARRRAWWSTTTAATPDRARPTGGAARSRYGFTRRTGGRTGRCGT